jgi:hypothetical protein
MLWLNVDDPSKPGARRFVNVGKKTGTHDGGWGWGAKLADLDNDGLMDIVAVNGFVTGHDPEHTYWYDLQEMVTQLENVTSDAADWPVMGDRDLSGRETTRLWLQRPSKGGGIAFEEAAVRVGVDDVLNGRGLALLDAENDGDLDLLIANQSQKASYYRNRLYEADRSEPVHWLGLDLVGDPARREEGAAAGGRGKRRFSSTRSAVGTRVVLRTAGRTQTRIVTSASGFAAQSDPRIFFGLGSSAEVEGLEIHWPSGRVDRIGSRESSALVDAMTRIVEGQSPSSVRDGTQ